MAEGVGLEPTYPVRIADFKSAVATSFTTLPLISLECS